MSIKQIILELVDIQSKIEMGEIEFSYDKLYSALKVDPAEALAKIIMDVYEDVLILGRSASKEKVNSLYEGLVSYNQAFLVKELENPIQELKELVDNGII